MRQLTKQEILDKWMPIIKQLEFVDEDRREAICAYAEECSKQTGIPLYLKNIEMPEIDKETHKHFLTESIFFPMALKISANTIFTSDLE